MPFICVNQVNLYYEEHGQGQPVLLLHALGSCADDWALQIPPLAARFRVLALDLRGHGRSDKPDMPYTMALFASDTAAALEALHVETACVVGLSLGGCVAQQLALDFPQHVRRLVLVNTFAHLEMTGISQAILIFIRMGLLATMGLPAQAQMVANTLFPQRQQAALRQMAYQRLAANDPAAYKRTLAAVRDFDIRAGLAAIACPTLVVAGAGDTTVRLPTKQYLAKNIPAARLEIVANSGHATPIDQPETFNRLMMDFIDEG